MDHNFKCKEICRTFIKSTGENLWDLVLGKEVSDMTTKTQFVGIGKLDLIKIKKCYSMKDIIKRSHIANSGKIFSNHSCNKEPVSKDIKDSQMQD